MSNTKDFSCIGGLEKHIRVVKETVLFPLMYGEVYAKFNLKPPRGLLFYGPPGTGKTLVASALAAECSNSERKVSFIARKGSDCLSKWVGESERKLQRIFSMAQQTKPCIIFFDEIDGLAPIRTSRQDFVHASIVSTLLALMDGLENNSEIIVIGATNRLDAIDPALRRPGRFDRELYFPLPCYSARKDILSVFIKTWKQKPAQKFLAYLASETVGFCGSDLQALCTEAVMCCVRRNYPEMYTTKTKFSINEKQLKVEKEDFLQAQQNIEPASHRVSTTPVKSLSPKIQPLLQTDLLNIISQLEFLCPKGMLTTGSITGTAASRSPKCPKLMLCGEDDSHTRHLGPALLHRLEHLPCHVLDVTTLFEETGRAVEEAIIQKMKTARRSLPSLLYIPDILAWWYLVDEPARVVFTSLINSLESSIHLLVIGTADCKRHDLPAEITDLFDQNRKEVFPLNSPGTHERELFFKQLFVNPAFESNSNNSSEEDLIRLMSPRRTRASTKLKNAEQIADESESLPTYEVNLPLNQKTKSWKARSKLCAVEPLHTATVKLTKTTMKRKMNAAGEGTVSKRAKSSSSESLTMSAIENLSECQVDDLLKNIVATTEGWSCNYLQNLYASLELNFEECNDDIVSTVQEILNHFRRNFKK